MENKILLAVTPGDPAGIGPEILLKTLRASAMPVSVALVCVGAREPLDRLGANVIEVDAKSLTTLPPRPSADSVYLIPAPLVAPKGKLLAGFQSGWAIETATRLVQKGALSALVTGPISKDRLQQGGYKFPGHTEFLAHLCKRKQVTMMLANDQLRVTLVTVHVALSRVSKSLTRASISQTILHTVDHLTRWWGIAKPSVAVAALNPHAGERGLFGDEEKRLITPVVRSLQKKLGSRAALVGPLPADTLFAQHVLSKTENRPENRFDAVVCMYHDQALIPVKILDFPHTVNITLGLPIIRTSVDHGVGFDIAGTGKADPSSFQSAVALAAQLVQRSKRGES